MRKKSLISHDHILVYPICCLCVLCVSSELSDFLAQTDESPCSCSPTFNFDGGVTSPFACPPAGGAAEAQ